MTATAPRWPIRPARVDDPHEVSALYNICLRTGDCGQDATALYRDPRLLGEVYLGAYLRLAPTLAFVLTDEDDTPVGYTVGTVDTVAFDAECERLWWPALRDRYPLGESPGAPESEASESRDAALVDLIHLPPLTDRETIRDYPAHLHIDLLPQAQGGGRGRRLIEHLLAVLHAGGAPGVHLNVAPANQRAIGFYEHLGFRRLDPRDDGLLGRRLA